MSVESTKELPSILKPTKTRRRSVAVDKLEVKEKIVKIKKERSPRTPEQIQKDKERMESVRSCRKKPVEKV